MKIRIREDRGYQIVVVKGKLNGPVATESLRVALDNVIDQGARCIVVNMRSVRSLNSAASVLLQGYCKKTADAGGGLIFVRPRARRLRRAVPLNYRDKECDSKKELREVIVQMPIYDREKDAIAALTTGQAKCYTMTVLPDPSRLVSRGWEKVHISERDLT